MRELKTEIQIAAPPEKVWDILADFNTWKSWNPIVSDANGMAALGSKLTVVMCGKDGQAAQKYKPVITVFQKPRSLHWRAKMMAKVLFTNDKILELKEVSGGTNVIHSEMFGGLMVPMFWGMMKREVPTMLEKMNKALKKKVEEN